MVLVWTFLNCAFLFKKNPAVPLDGDFVASVVLHPPVFGHGGNQEPVPRRMPQLSIPTLIRQVRKGTHLFFLH